jgi:hypothetical protein
MGKAIHHAQANFMVSQVRGAIPEPPAVRQAQQYARTKVFGARAGGDGRVPQRSDLPPLVPPPAYLRSFLARFQLQVCFSISALLYSYAINPFFIVDFRGKNQFPQVRWRC